MTIKEVQELFIKAHADAEAIRLKYQGKAADMTADEQSAWEKALGDADKYQAQIELLKKSQRHDDWAKKAEDIARTSTKDAERTGRTEIVKAWVGALLGDVPKDTYRKDWEGDILAKGLSVGSNVQGGYFLVPIEIAQEIIRTVEDECFIRKFSPTYTLTSSESLGIVTRGDLDDFAWVSELTTGSDDTNEPFGRRELSPKPSAKRFKVSRKLMRMSNQPEAEMRELMTYVRARTEEKAFLTGNGANQPLGIMTEDASGISTARTRATGTANVIAADDLINAVADMKGTYRMGARWLLHRNLEGRIRKLKDSQNNYLWSPFGGVGQGLAGANPATICGFPYDVSEFLVDPGLTGNITTGTMIAVLANYQRGYRIVDALAMEIIPLTELQALTNELQYVYRFETDGMPVDENAFSRLKAA